MDRYRVCKPICGAWGNTIAPGTRLLVEALPFTPGWVWLYEEATRRLVESCTERKLVACCRPEPLRHQPDF